MRIVAPPCRDGKFLPFGSRRHGVRESFRAPAWAYSRRTVSKISKSRPPEALDPRTAPSNPDPVFHDHRYGHARTGGCCRYETPKTAEKTVAPGGPRGDRASAFAKYLRFAPTTSWSIKTFSEEDGTDANAENLGTVGTDAGGYSMDIPWSVFIKKGHGEPCPPTTLTVLRFSWFPRLRRFDRVVPSGVFEGMTRVENGFVIEGALQGVERVRGAAGGRPAGGTERVDICSRERLCHHSHPFLKRV